MLLIAAEEEDAMWLAVRLVFIFVFGFATTKTIQESTVGAFVMGAISVLLTIWLVYDVANNPQYYLAFVPNVHPR
jgi:hypothetical protein